MVLLLDHTTDAGENKRPALLTKGMRDGNGGIVENPSEQVGVGAGVYELQYKLIREFGIRESSLISPKGATDGRQG